MNDSNSLTNVCLLLNRKKVIMIKYMKNEVIAKELLIPKFTLKK